jgi:hypothetical protein
MKLLDDVDPIAAKGMRRQVLEALMERAAHSGSAGQGLSTVPVSPAKLVSAATNYDRQIRALFAGDWRGYRNWLAGVKSAQILADRGMTGISPTAPLQWTMQLVNTFTRDIKRLVNPMHLAADIASLLAPAKMAKFMMNPEAGPHLRAMLKTGNHIKAVAGAVNTLMAIDRRDDLLSYRPDDVENTDN